jgi:hypothetical protein
MRSPPPQGYSESVREQAARQAPDVQTGSSNWQIRFGETPKPACETHALPSLFAITRRLLANNCRTLTVSLHGIGKLCFGSRSFRLRIDHAGLSHIEIIEHIAAAIEFFFEVFRCRSVTLRFFHTCSFRSFGDRIRIPRCRSYEEIVVIIHRFRRWTQASWLPD